MLGAVHIVGCGGAESPPGVSPDAGLAPDTIRPSITLIEEVLSSDAPYWAGAQSPSAVFAAFEDRLNDIRTATTSALSPVSGRIVGVGASEQGLLVAASDGYYIVDGHELVPSPLGNVLELQPFGLMSVTHAGGQELWLAGETGLAVWSAGRVRHLRPEGLPTAQCVMTSGAQVDGEDAVWLACQGTLYALTRTAFGYRAHVQDEVIGARALAADDNQTVWSVDGEGTVWSRSSVGVWRSHDFASNVESVFGAGNGVWFQTMTGLWHHDNSGFAQVTSPAVTSVYAGLPAGQVLLQTAAGFIRGFTHREIRIAGLQPGALLQAATRLTLHPVEPERVQQVTMTLGDDEVVLDSDWGFELDPAALDRDGSYNLVTTAIYDDGEEVQAMLHFSYFAGPAPTWLGDVNSIFDDHCSVCHGVGGGARVLDSSQAWQAEIEDIINNVKSGRMPLPPNRLLSTEQIERIEGWKAAGYPEGE